MMREILWRERMQNLANAMDAFADRHRAIASNIANSEVPGYEPRSVEFERYLSRAMGDPEPRTASTHPHHFPTTSDPADVRHTIEENSDGGNMAGVNDVDIDTQMVQLATNRIHYEATVLIAQRRFTEMTRLITSK